LIFLTVFFLSALIQFIYLAVFLVAFNRKQAVKGANVRPVSVIVCAHDEEQNLRELVPVLLDQHHESFEVIVVNDRSNDNTYDYLLEETKKDQRLKMVNVKDTPDHINSKKFAITLGIRAAVNDVVLLTDADCRPSSKEWISAMSRQFEDNTQFVVGFSPYRSSPGFLNLFIRFESLITAMQYLAFAVAGNPYMGVGRNLAYRKSLFLEKKGFNNFLHVTGGDDDLFVNQHANGKNTRAEFGPDSLVYSLPKTTWSSFFNQKVRHMSVGKRYKPGHKLLIGLFMASWILTLFVGFPLIGFPPAYDIVMGYVVVGVLLFRWLLMILSVHNFVNRAGLVFRYWVIPILDFLYPIYYISTGLVTLFTRKVRWTK
jgi:glycosyltransferase involved in cell wall biosynthesis